MNVTINKIKYNELKKFFQLEKKICLRNFAKSYRSVMSCTLATKTADLFVLITNPLLRTHCYEATEAIVFENRRSSSLPAAGDVSQGRTSATQRQKIPH